MNEHPGSGGDDVEDEPITAASDTNAPEANGWAAWERAEEAAQNESGQASILMFNLAREGHLAASLSVAQTLRSKPLSDDIGRRADVIIARLWASRVQSRPDEEADQAAAALLTDPGELNPWQRTLLHVNIAARIQADLTADLDDVEASVEHLLAAYSLAKTLGSRGLQATVLSRLALAEIPRGRPSVASELAQAALDLTDFQPDATGSDVPFWMIRARLALGWAAYFQGTPIPSEQPPGVWTRPESASDLVLVSLTFEMIARSALQAGQMQAARTALATALVNKRFSQSRVWSVPLVMLDAYLAVHQGDRASAQDHLARLDELPAPAEATLVRSLVAAQRGDLSEALDLVHQITSGALRPVSMTFASACTYEAGLLEVLGRHDEADASMEQALAWTEPIGARGVFATFLPGPNLVLARRVAAANPGNAWAADVVKYLETVITPGIATRSLSEPGPDAPVVSLDTPLTPRELEVLALISGGSSQSEIARDLFVSLNTVKTHLRSIRQKLGVARTGEAAALARSAGWL